MIFFWPYGLSIEANLKNKDVNWEWKMMIPVIYLSKFSAILSCTCILEFVHVVCFETTKKHEKNLQKIHFNPSHL